METNWSEKKCGELNLYQLAGITRGAPLSYIMTSAQVVVSICLQKKQLKPNIYRSVKNGTLPSSNEHVSTFFCFTTTCLDILSSDFHTGNKTIRYPTMLPLSVKMLRWLSLGHPLCQQHWRFLPPIDSHQVGYAHLADHWSPRKADSRRMMGKSDDSAMYL